MILQAEDKQFKLADDGQILWQQDPTNPLPGAPVARIKKGEALLKPRADVIDSNLLDGQDKNAVAEKIGAWLERYVHFALEPLFRLTGGDDLSAQARGIAFQLQEALGILPRQSIEDLISGLDEEGRKALRARKVRMGPLLVFMPDLNKPAAVKLRAVLLTLWRGKELPAEVPKDGIVSFTVEGKNLDADYYRSIGYPIYGPRSIRVDMLDRVVCAVYDSAKDGKFQAQHKMAEWLGSNILDLYAVLTAMGHTMLHDPAAEKAKDLTAPLEHKADVSPALEALDAIAPTEEVKAPEEDKAERGIEALPVEEAAGSAPSFAAVPVTTDTASATPEAKAKPELATFRLKRGKASDSAKPREQKPFEKKGKPEKTFSKDKKPFSERKKEDGKSFKGKKSEKPKHDDREDKIYSSAPSKMEDSPFAILSQLKLGNDKKK